MEEYIKIEWCGQPVLTSKQLAKVYNVTPENISKNFSNNKLYFQEGNHYFKLTGAALRQFKAMLAKMRRELAATGIIFDWLDVSQYAAWVFLWTYQGCARHCKMINNPTALEILEELRTKYFEVDEPKVDESKIDPLLIRTVKGIRCYVDEEMTIHINAEDVARGLGFVEGGKFSTNGENYIRWERVNSYLAEFDYPHKVGKEDYLPENVFYRLAMKANNATALKFQAKIADEILPSIRSLKEEYLMSKEPKIDPLLIRTVKGIRCYVDEEMTIHINAEDVARGLGFVEVKKDRVAEGCDKPYTAVRWRTINEYLKSFGYPQEVGKEDYLPENVFYRLAMKANNATALKFQAKIADEILPSIRKHGYYMSPNSSLQNKQMAFDLHTAGQRVLESNDKIIPPDKELAHELIALADKIKDDEARDKILIHAANLLIGKDIF